MEIPQIHRATVFGLACAALVSGCVGVGGLFNGGMTTIRNGTFNNNATRGKGGAIYKYLADLSIVRSTINDNIALSDGGAIYAHGNVGSSAPTALYSTSIIHNFANAGRDKAGQDGGIFVEFNTIVGMVNTLPSDNVRPAGTLIASDRFGPVQVCGWDLLSEANSCTFRGNIAASYGLTSSGLVNLLCENGGSTRTNALPPSSQAIAFTLSQGCIDETGALLSTDQCGAPRVLGAGCDAGAFRFGAVVSECNKSASA